jgi:ribosomal protein S10
MKLRELTEVQKQRYINDITSVTKNYDEMIHKINGLLLQYGDIHYKMTVDMISVNYARDKKAELRVQLKNTNITALDQIVATLKDTKEKYIKDIAPVTAITDPLELSFIEKELKVMKDSEVLDYYKENYLDSNITRLIEIEWKTRKGYKDGKIMMELPKYDAVDPITNRIDQEIKVVIGLRQVVENMCCFQEPTDGGNKPVMIPWNNILEQVENRNSSTVVRVTIGELYKYNISK